MANARGAGVLSGGVLPVERERADAEAERSKHLLRTAERHVTRWLGTC